MEALKVHVSTSFQPIAFQYVTMIDSQFGGKIDARGPMEVMAGELTREASRLYAYPFHNKINMQEAGKKRFS